MNLKDIFSVSGKPGLYKLISHTKNGAIVESLIEGVRFPIFASDRASSLHDISIFASTEDITLTKVLQNIFTLEEGKEASVSSKADNKLLQQYMDKVLPEWDKSRVHTSDIKKLVSWYNILLSKNLIDLVEEKSEEDEDRTTEIENS